MSKQQGIELPAWHGNTLGSMSCLAPVQHTHFVHGGLPQRHPWGLRSSYCRSVQRLSSSCGELALAFTALTQKLLQNFLVL